MRDGRVFALRLDDPVKIKEIKSRDGLVGDLNNFFPTEEPQKLWAWYPGNRVPRMVVQQSLYIFGCLEIRDPFISGSFVLTAREKEELLILLDRLGVSENFMFSDLAGFSVANTPDKDYDLRRAESHYTEKINTLPASASHYFHRGVFRSALGLYEEAFKRL